MDVSQAVLVHGENDVMMRRIPLVGMENSNAQSNYAYFIIPLLSCLLLLYTEHDNLKWSDLCQTSPKEIISNTILMCLICVK